MTYDDYKALSPEEKMRSRVSTLAAVAMTSKGLVEDLSDLGSAGSETPASTAEAKMFALLHGMKEVSGALKDAGDDVRPLVERIQEIVELSQKERLSQER
jgi:hypothetical protein